MERRECESFWRRKRRPVANCPKPAAPHPGPESKHPQNFSTRTDLCRMALFVYHRHVATARPGNYLELSLRRRNRIVTTGCWRDATPYTPASTPMRGSAVSSRAFAPGPILRLCRKIERRCDAHSPGVGKLAATIWYRPIAAVGRFGRPGDAANDERGGRSARHTAGQAGRARRG